MAVQGISSTDSMRRMPDADTVIFECNICDAVNGTELALLDREGPTCRRCGSSVRFRSIIQALTTELFGRSVNISQIRPKNFDIRGYGLSCWDGYSSRLRRHVDFRNTFFHRKPYLDITDIDREKEGSLDFLIASDVFEHIQPPVQRAFDNARRLLKDDGVFIITVPFTHPGEDQVPAQEHFPELFEYEIRKDGDSFLLENTTRGGVKQVFGDLIFHGGPGSTLEMRVFSESSLVSSLFAAGFDQVTIYSGSDLAHGIHWSSKCSVTVAARTGQHQPKFIRVPVPRRYRPSLMAKGAHLLGRAIAGFHKTQAWVRGRNPGQ
ncbi:MAG: methyltransferase domain-containing protein [Proteobacteria bacterium]|nr:methyltransferase domain-containing protein [Pseudomonadota bacterium]